MSTVTSQTYTIGNTFYVSEKEDMYEDILPECGQHNCYNTKQLHSKNTQESYRHYNKYSSHAVIMYYVSIG